jgi:hypothetical protein
MSNRMKNEPPWDFLLSASHSSLQSFELSRLSYAANVRKEIVELLDIWLEETSSALLARWLQRQSERSAQGEATARGDDLRKRAAMRAVSDNFPAGPAMPIPRVRTAP